MTASTWLEPGALAALEAVVDNAKKNDGAGGRYTSPSKIPDGGEGKFRIKRGISGWEAWTTENKPVRWEILPEELPSNLKDKPKHFNSFVVFDYHEENPENAVKILHVTQMTIKKALLDFYKEEDFGDPTRYDIKIRKTGDGMEARYSVFPMPPKSLTDNVKKAFAEEEVRLEALFDGSNPFAEE